MNSCFAPYFSILNLILTMLKGEFNSKITMLKGEWSSKITMLKRECNFVFQLILLIFVS